MEFNDDIPVINVNKIARYMHMELIKMGYVPSSDEILDIAAIMIDFLIDIEAIEDDNYE